MTPEILDWASGVVHRYGLAAKSATEIGSLDVNGSLRRLFIGPYIGLDQFEGPGVDVVANIRDKHALDYLEAQVMVCTEVIEHDPRPWEVISLLAKHLLPGGHLILTAPSIAFHRHDYPDDYYRYTVAGLCALAEHAGLEVAEGVELPGLVMFEGQCYRIAAATVALVARKP